MARVRSWAAIIALSASSCGGSPPPVQPAPSQTAAEAEKASGEDTSWRQERPETGKPAPIDYPPALVATLENGLDIYVVERPAGIVSISLVSRGGSLWLSANQSGLAALTARMMTEATKKRSSLELAKAVESLGSSLEHGAGRDFVRIGLSAVATDLEAALELLAEITRQPAFRTDELERVRDEWLDTIEADKQDPQTLASRVGLRLLFDGPAGAPVNGTTEDVDKLKRRALTEHHRRAFRPDEAALFVVGPVSLARVKQHAEALFGAWGARAKTKATSPVVQSRKGKRTVFLVDRPGSVQSAVFVAQPLPERAAPGYEARQVLNNAFGGLFTSRLNQNLREQHGYTYGARSFAASLRHFGLFVISTAVQAEVTAEALVEIFSELRRLETSPLSDEEIARSKADLIQSAGAALEHTHEVLSGAEDLFVYELPADYQSTYPSRIEALDAGTINAQAALLDQSRMLVVIAGDRSEVAPSLEAKGFRVESAPASAIE